MSSISKSLTMENVSILKNNQPFRENQKTDSKLEIAISNIFKMVMNSKAEWINLVSIPRRAI